VDTTALPSSAPWRGDIAPDITIHPKERRDTNMTQMSLDLTCTKINPPPPPKDPDELHNYNLVLKYLADSGLTLDALLNEIEKAQPRNSGNPVDRMGLGPELIGLIERYLTPDNEAVLYLYVARAVQHLVCNRV
jgi:hypothetical protein